MTNRIFPILGAFILLASLLQTAPAQAPSPSPSPSAPKADEVAAEFKKQSVIFLRETATELNNLRSIENRISFSGEVAGLMWFHDEKEARGMFNAVMIDFRQLLSQYDSQLSLLEAGTEVTTPAPFFLGDDSDKGKLARKFKIAMGVRQQIAASMAEHDPQMALDFFYDSLNSVANLERREQFETQDKIFETQLLSKVAEKDASKAAAGGKKSIENGVDHQHIELLKKIYAKDADKGAEFADAITQKLKDKIGNTVSLSEVLELGIDNVEKVKKEGGKKKTMFSEQNLRDLSEALAQAVLEPDDEEEYEGDPMAHVELIEKYSPGRAAQIRNKYGLKRSVNARGTGSGIVGRRVVPPRDPNRYTVMGSANSNTSVPSGETAAEKAQAEKKKREEQAMKDVQSLGTKPLPKEEREKIVSQARKIVSEMGSKEEKIMAISMLGAQVSKAGDKELAADVMKDAAALVNPQPKNYKDFMLVGMLAAGYAEADPEKAFPLIQDSIYRINDVIAGLVRVAEFIDVGGELVDDGEVQVGSFGGSMTRGMTGELGVVNGTLRSLAKADIVKTKALTNAFDRAEIRALAKMLVLRAIMDEKSSSTKEDDISEVPESFKKGLGDQ